MIRTLLALAASTVLALPLAAEPIATFQDPQIPGSVRGSTSGPVRGRCSGEDALAPANILGHAAIVDAPPQLGMDDPGDRVLLLSTAPSDGPDTLAQTSWETVFEITEPSLLHLRLAFVTRDDASVGDWWTLLLDGEPFSCGDAAHVELTRQNVLAPGDQSTEWMNLGGGLPIGVGTHVLQVVVGDGTDSTGASSVLLDDVVAGPVQPMGVVCQPAPPEDVGEVPYQPGVNPQKWTFDDNRFCSGGPQLSCARCLSGAPTPCQPGDPEVNPNDGFVDSTNRSFEMYVVADCGREMHLPLFDVESGCVSVFDENRFPVAIQVTNNAGFNQSGGEVCWNATNCDGGGGNNPGGPGDQRVMDVSFTGSPALCGVYIVNFRSWAGCIWDLYANCDGTGSEGFRIYDDFCEAQAAVNLLPEIVIDDMTLSSGTGCFVDYCVTIENIGCSTAGPFTLHVQNEIDSNNHLVTLGSGSLSQQCGTLDVLDSGSVTTTFVTAIADFGNAVVECTENPTASACDPASGADTRTESTTVECNQVPVCDAGGPYFASCNAPGTQSIPLDGSGSYDPDGGTLTYLWTTNCPNSTIQNPNSRFATLVVTQLSCSTCLVSLQVTDSSGATSTCSATVSLGDTQPPLLTCPANSTVECAGPGAHDAERNAWLASATATDACSGSRTVTHSLVNSTSPCPGSTIETWHFSATDNCGNTATCDRTWSDLDTLPPVVTPPAPATYECPAPANALSTWLASATASDACAGALPVSSTLLQTVTPCPGTSIKTYRFTATDPCGHSASADSTFTVQDTTPPTISGVPADTTAECSAIPGPASPTASDTCDASVPVTFTETSIPGTCPQRRTIVRTWTATDDCGNTTTRQQHVNVVDTVAPSISGVPADTTVECNAVPGPASPTATDACDPIPTLTFAETTAPGPCPQSSTITRTWTATDHCGNSTTRQQHVTVVDTVAPSINGVPADTTVQCTAIPGPASPTVSDACDPIPTLTFSETSSPGPCPQAQTITRTWTATDHCGNSTTRQQRITVVDTVAPSISGVPADNTVQCSAIPPPASPTATDACDPNPTLTFSETTAPGPCPQAQTITRTWTATDHCGNSTTRQQRLTVVDTLAPSISGVPADNTVQCSAIPPPASPTATDACDPNPTLTFSETSSPGPCPQAQTITRTWTATDHCGNSTTRQQHLTVVDTVAPSLSGVPSDATVPCQAIPVPATPTATDACDPNPTITFSESSTPGRCPQEQTITRTWTATDHCGNSTTRQQRITVVDNAAPVLTGVPPNATVSCSSVPGPAPVGALDACDPNPTVTMSESSTHPITLAADPEPTGGQRRVLDRGRTQQQALSHCPDDYVITRTWTATDACGNSASATQTIQVTDLIAPAMSGVPADRTVECTSVPPPANVTATDNCDPAPGVSFNEQRLPGPCDNAFQLRRTWTATDRCGNVATAQQMLTVIDDEPPTLNPPANKVIECPAPTSGPDSEAAWLASATATDGCGSATVQHVELSRTPGCGATYVAVFELWALDQCSNQSGHVTRSYTVVDTTPPVLNPPANKTVECPAPTTGPDSEAGWLATATATDGCGAATPQHRELSRTPGCGNTYVAVFELWAVDACGNESARVNRTYTVVDTTPPVLNAPPDLTVECPAPSSGPNSEAEWRSRASATDTCGSATVTWREISRVPGCGHTYVATFEVWATDQCANESAHQTRLYRVVDTTPPVFGGPGPEQFAYSIWPPNHGYVVYQTGDVVGASDACGSVTTRVTGCRSSQPEEVHQGPTDDGGNGDGHFYEDCVISTDGTQFAVRAERLGSCGADSARIYSIEFTATDECGNSAPGEGQVIVEHDRSNHQPVNRGRKLGPNDPPPFPYVHPTIYGTGCGP